MPSPFPGIDPFIEMQEWSDFHGQFLSDIADDLNERGGQKYVVRYQRRVYVEQERREGYLTIRDTETLESVTRIELLSPSNKRRRGKGRKVYLRKREEILQSDVHLVEIDLLRGGARMPTLVPLPPNDYSVIVSRSERRPRADAYSWTLNHRQ